jgi:glycosyltransferase involved in cell wall biosynthesis
MVSVIIPNYNHSRFLKKRIDSVLNQSYHDFEIILLDDCSSDRSHEVLAFYKNHPKVSTLIINEQNSGSPFKQWQRGLDLAMGEYVWIAESDDWAAPTFLVEMVKVLKENPTVGLVSCRSEFVDHNGLPLKDQSLYKQTFTRPGKEELLNSLAFRNSIHNASSVVFRRELAIPFPTSISKMKYCGDWIFWANILKKSDFYFLNQKLNFYRRHEGNVSFSAEKNKIAILEGIQVCRIVFSYEDISDYNKETIVEYWLNAILNSYLDKKSRLGNIRKKIKLMGILFECSPSLLGRQLMKKLPGLFQKQ